MCLNHPDLWHKHPALLVSPVTRYIGDGSVQSNHPELMC